MMFWLTSAIPPHPPRARPEERNRRWALGTSAYRSAAPPERRDAASVGDLEGLVDPRDSRSAVADQAHGEGADARPSRPSTIRNPGRRVLRPSPELAGPVFFGMTPGRQSRSQRPSASPRVLGLAGGWLVSPHDVEPVEELGDWHCCAPAGVLTART